MSTTPVDHPDWQQPIGAPSAVAVTAHAAGGGSSRLVSPGAGKFLRVWGVSAVVVNTDLAGFGQGSIVDDNGNALLFVGCDVAPAAGTHTSDSGSLYLGGVLLPVGVGLLVESNGGNSEVWGTLVYSIVST